MFQISPERLHGEAMSSITNVTIGRKAADQVCLSNISIISTCPGWPHCAVQTPDKGTDKQKMSRLPKKTVEECKEDILTILTTGLEKSYITEEEKEEALNMTDWNLLQPILDRAQGYFPPTEEEIAAFQNSEPSYRDDFEPEVLERMKVLSPIDYKYLR